MNTLQCRQPPIIRSPFCNAEAESNRFYQDLFTWNGDMNVMAAERSRSSVAYQWLDYVMYSTHKHIPTPLYADNHRELIAMQPFPDLSSLSSSKCFSTSANNHEMDAKERLEKGKAQLAILLQRFNQLLKKHGYPPFSKPELAVDPPTKNSLKLNILRAWALFVRTSNYFDSSQVWKGFKFFGFKSGDHLTEQQRAMLELIYIGAPHPFRMLYHASDHFGVSARIVLP